MKKFYAIAAAAMTALSMNADLYVCGAGDGLGWDPANPMVVELADGNYTFDVTNLVQFKISSEMGSWDAFNGGALQPEAITEDNLGTPLALAAGDGNISAPWKGDYHIVVAGDLSTITLTTTTPNPGDGPKEIFVRGGMNGWGSPAEWMFTAKEGSTTEYSFVCKDATKIEAGVEFKIADADWGNINYGAAGIVTIDEESWWNYDDQNSQVAEDFEGTIFITLPEEVRGELTVEFKAGVFNGVETIAVAAGEAEYFNLQGVRVANPAQGLYIVRQGGVVTKQVIR